MAHVNHSFTQFAVSLFYFSGERLKEALFGLAEMENLQGKRLFVGIS